MSQLRKTRYAFDMPQPLARIVDQLKREPSRTGSIVITVFGDAIVRVAGEHPRASARCERAAEPRIVGQPAERGREGSRQNAHRSET